MRSHLSLRAALGGAVLAATLVAGAGVAGAQGVFIGVYPPDTTVTPGAEFDLTVRVTQAGSAFNAFDVVVGHDPAALTRITLSPVAQQEGSLMTSACGNRYHLFRPGTDRDTCTDVLLCSNVSVTGPGTIYRLHFKASDTGQYTVVRFLPGTQFFNAGLFVNPYYGSGALIRIGTPTAVGNRPVAGTPLLVHLAPNPAGARMTINIDSNVAGPESLAIYDVLGRLVRRFPGVQAPAGPHEVQWDGRDDSGRRLDAGVYFVDVSQGSRSTRARAALLP